MNLFGPDSTNWMTGPPDWSRQYPANDAGVDAGYLAAQAEDIAARIDRSGLDALPESNLRLALREPS